MGESLPIKERNSKACKDENLGCYYENKSEYDDPVTMKHIEVRFTCFLYTSCYYSRTPNPQLQSPKLQRPMVCQIKNFVHAFLRRTFSSPVRLVRARLPTGNEVLICRPTHKQLAKTTTITIAAAAAERDSAWPDYCRRDTRKQEREGARLFVTWADAQLLSIQSLLCEVLIQAMIYNFGSEQIIRPKQKRKRQLCPNGRDKKSLWLPSRELVHCFSVAAKCFFSVPEAHGCLISLRRGRQLFSAETWLTKVPVKEGARSFPRVPSV